jgi:hypothetical protein
MPTEKIIEKLYSGEITLEFMPASHRYRLEGSKEYLPSVTSCTGIIDKSRFLIPWAVGLAGSHIRKYLEENSSPFTTEQILLVVDEAMRQHQIKKEEAASIGGQVHAYAEAFALSIMEKKGVPAIPDDVTDERVRAGINAFLNWFVENDVQFLHAEKLVYSKSLGYAGLVDAIANVNGKRMLIDHKTSKGVYNEMRYQVAAYCMAFEEEHGEQLDGAMILHFDKETGTCNQYLYTREDIRKDSVAFGACLDIKKREKELSKTI